MTEVFLCRILCSGKPSTIFWCICW